MGQLTCRRRVCGIRFRVCISCLRERGLRGLYGIVVSNFILLLPTPPPNFFFFFFFSFFQTLLKRSTLSAFKVIPLSLLFSRLLLHKMPYLSPFPPLPYKLNRHKVRLQRKGTFIHNKDKTIGSSRGRGTRAAGWFDDHIQKQKNPHMKSLTLAEGIKGWSGAGKEYTDLMDGYEERVWREGKGEK